jgi:putative Holliday junction resolvase
MRILGLDIGSSRIGVALSDETGLIASPLTCIEVRRDFANAVTQITDLCEEHEVNKIVIGLPLSLSGGGGGMSVRMVKKLGTLLENNLNREIVYMDERFTTAEAERLLISADVRRDSRRKVVDKVAASLILQSYLDANDR